MKLHFHSPCSMLHAPRRGQVLIVTVLALGATILAATTIAGLLLVYQIRQATDLSNSGRAIYAADTGIEWGHYQFAEKAVGRTAPGTGSGETHTLENGAIYTTTCYDTSNNAVDCSAAEAALIHSFGSAGTANRAFEYRNISR